MELALVDRPGVHASGEVFVAPPGCRYVVISDIDDTIIETGVANKALMLWRLFMQGAEGRIAFPGVAALLRAYPQTFGATPQELADRFGFIARPADAKSEDADVRAGLPVGMHLTIDPITNVPFVVTSCALCHAERVRWTSLSS